MNNLDKQYTALLQDILDNGVRKSDRTGTGTLSVFGRQIRHKMSEGFPLLTTKKMHWEGIVTELIWFLKGDTNIKYLVDNGCNIWNGDAYKNYESKMNFSKRMQSSISSVDGEEWKVLSKEEFINKIKTDDDFAEKWGELGPIYGKQWREWTYLTREKKEDVYGIDEIICGADMEESYRYYRTFDQIANLINDLKTNPDSRRLMVSAWNVGEMDSMVLPPCHYGFQVYTRNLNTSELLPLSEELRRVNEEKTAAVMAQSYEVAANLRTREKEILETLPKKAISLMWNQRSVDTFLGLPFNIASYGLLLEIIAREVNMVADELIGNLGDVHLYLNHIEQAKLQIGREYTEEEINTHLQESGMDALTPDAKAEYISLLPKRTREPFPLPNLKYMTHLDGFESWLFDKTYGVVLRPKDFFVDNYKSHPAIKAPLSN
jgi:thymidylate synthase